MTVSPAHCVRADGTNIPWDVTGLRLRADSHRADEVAGRDRWLHGQEEPHREGTALLLMVVVAPLYLHIVTVT